MPSKTYKLPFSNGDEVYEIWNGTEQYWEDCDLCDAKGRLKVKEKFINCPDCYGRKGEYKSKQKAWNVTKTTLTIGQVRVEHTKGDKIKLTAMCKETGIGSGAVHDMNNFFKTKEEAQAECNKRNA